MMPLKERLLRMEGGCRVWVGLCLVCLLGAFIYLVVNADEMLGETEVPTLREISMIPDCNLLLEDLRGNCVESSLELADVVNVGVDTTRLRALLINGSGDAVARVETLQNEGFVPLGRDVAPWPFELPVDWNADPYDDRNWRFQLHAWRMLDPVFSAWERERDSRYLDYAWRVMRDWHDFHLEQSGEFQWYDMSTGLRGSKLAYLTAQVMEGNLTLSRDDQRKLLNLLQSHALNLMDPVQLSTGNHGLFQLHGLMAQCRRAPGLAGCEGYTSYVGHELKDLLIGRQFSNEGIHLEASPEYHFFAHSTVSRLFSSGWYDEFDELVALMEQITQNRVFMVHPDKTIVTIGDSEPKQRNVTFPEGTPGCQESPASGDCNFMRVFEESGYAVIRSDWAVPEDRAHMLFFTAMHHASGIGHKLPDDLSFEWFVDGRRILSNAGKYSYNVDDFRHFVQSRRAHNTVDFEGRETPVHSKLAYGSGIVDSRREGEVFHVAGEVEHGLAEAHHRRELYYLPDRWLLVRDTISVGEPGPVTQWFHFDPGFELSEDDDLVLASDKEGSLYVRNLSGGTERRLVRGRREPSIQGWVTEDYNNMIPRFALGFSGDSSDTTFLTAFAFDKQALAEAEEYAERLDPGIGRTND